MEQPIRNTVVFLAEGRRAVERPAQQYNALAWKWCIFYVYKSWARPGHISHREEAVRAHRNENGKALYRFSGSFKVF